MKKATILAVAVASVLPLAAAEPTGFALWSSSLLKGYTAKLAPRVDEKKVAVEHLGKFDHHAALIGHRQGDGEAELHETQTDIFVVQDGTATLVVGGTVVDGRTTAPGEIRGPSIEGGEKHPLSPGDVVNIPARTAHQVLVPEGGRFTYLVIKVDTP